MSLARYLPNTRESAEETKRRVWQSEGMLVVNIDRDDMPWDMKVWLKQWAAKRFGPRREGGNVDGRSHSGYGGKD